MPRYIRAVVSGGTFFFTVALLERQRRLLTERIDELRAAFSATHLKKPFAIDAIVVLPDHLHGIWTLPAGDTDFSSRWQFIKTRFARAIPIGERLSPRRQVKGERGIWQRRFWEHVLRDERDFERQCGLHSLQSCEARSRATSWRMAVFQFSSLCEARLVCG